MKNQTKLDWTQFLLKHEMITCIGKFFTTIELDISKTKKFTGLPLADKVTAHSETHYRVRIRHNFFQLTKVQAVESNSKIKQQKLYNHFNISQDLPLLAYTGEECRLRQDILYLSASCLNFMTLTDEKCNFA